MLQSIGSGRVCSLLCWLRDLLADIAFMLSEVESEILEPAIGNCYHRLHTKGLVCRRDQRN